jgi:hypothetical protein
LDTLYDNDFFNVMAVGFWEKWKMFLWALCGRVEVWTWFLSFILVLSSDSRSPYFWRIAGSLGFNFMYKNSWFIRDRRVGYSQKWQIHGYPTLLSLMNHEFLYIKIEAQGLGYSPKINNSGITRQTQIKR